MFEVKKSVYTFSFSVSLSLSPIGCGVQHLFQAGLARRLPALALRSRVCDRSLCRLRDLEGFGVRLGGLRV